MQDLKNCCRLCASDGIHKIDIFLIQIENNSSIADDLSQLCNLKLENNTIFPRKICEQCAISIKNFRNFLLNSIKTQKLLTELLSNEINNSIQLKKEYKINIDHGIKQEEDDFSLFSKVECELKENWFSEDELVIENEMVEEITSNKNVPNENSNIFEDKNSYSEEDDEISNNLEESEDLPLSEIKRKINKKPCKTNNLKKEKPHLENDKNLIKDISINSKEKRVKSSKKQSKQYQCKLCDKSFSSQGGRGLTHHMKLAHSIKKPLYTCKNCGKKFGVRHALEQHESTHLPSEERKHLSCPHCDKKFQSYSGRWTHIRSVHDAKKTIVCEECGKKFATKGYLDRHKERHLEAKTFECALCPSKFKAKSGLRAHMRSHGESHPCLECGLHLKTRALLRDHMVIHSDVKNFKCNFCNKDFKRIRDLKFHLIRTHMGLNPFECRICHKRFPHNLSHRRHFEAVHPKEFKEMRAKGERISIRHFPPLQQIKDINEAAKSGNKIYNVEKTDENIVEKSEVQSENWLNIDYN